MENIKKKQQLCPSCKTGLDMLRLDKREPLCPFMVCHKGESCSMYIPVLKGTAKA
ncbi:MAG: hypothetical protein Q4C12_07605 [Clostridia bacterium]|nr:hypothetical protein [Clostridia bacterium]